MKKIFVHCLILMGFICSKRTFGQSLTAELASMETAWVLGGSFNTKLKKTSKLSFSNVSRFSTDYLRKEEIHMLIMTNLGYSISPKLKSTFGGIYTNSSGLRPSVGLQYAVTKKKFQWSLFPNLNIGSHSDLMTLSMVQYIRQITEKMKFVLRLQSMMMYNTHGHIFSTMRFRSGIIRGRYQFGVASDFNYAGNDYEYSHSYGLFMLCQLF